MHARLFLSALAFAIAAGLSCKPDEPRPAFIDDPSGPRVPLGGGGGAVTDASLDASGLAGAIATAPGEIRGLAVSASDVYFVYVDPGDGGVADDGGPLPGGTLARVPRTGGTTELVVTGGFAPRALSIADGVLYWVDDGSVSSSLIRLGPSSLGALVSGLSRNSVFAVSAGAIVVATDSVASVSLDRVPDIDGGVLQSLGLLTGDLRPVRVVIDGNSVLLLAASAVGGGLYRMPLVGGVPEEIWSTASGAVRDFVVGDNRALIAWDRGDDGQILSVPLGGGATSAFAAPVRSPARIAIDGTDVFYITADGELSRASLAGGSVATLATGLGSPSALAIADAAYVATANVVVRVKR